MRSRNLIVWLGQGLLLDTLITAANTLACLQISNVSTCFNLVKLETAIFGEVKRA